MIPIYACYKSLEKILKNIIISIISISRYSTKIKNNKYQHVTKYNTKWVYL